MDAKPLIGLLALAVLTGCAATGGKWVTLKEVPATADVVAGMDLSRFPKANVACVKQGSPVSVDADLGEWEGADWMVLDRREQYVGEGWEGPDDVSGKLALAYDAENLYLAAEVRDNVVSWGHAGGDLWMADSIQVSLDPWLTRPVKTYSLDVVEFGFSGREGGAGVETWRWACGRPLDPGPLPAQTAVQGPADGMVRYELAIPLAELGSWRPSLTGRTGGSWLINDNDGKEREGFLEWTPGIGATKDPSSYGVFVYEAPPEGEQLPGLMARFHWDRTLAAQGRPIEVLVQTLSQGGGRVVNLSVQIDGEEPKRMEKMSVPLEPGRHTYAVVLHTGRLGIGRHKLLIDLDDGRGYTASTSRSIYIYPPAKYGE